MANILLTLAEDRSRTTESSFAVRYAVDEEDCFDFARGLQELGHQVYFANWDDLAGDSLERVFLSNRNSFQARHRVDFFDLAFVYKMEGFYFDLERFYAMVRTMRKHCGVVVNHPETIAHNIDKRYLFDLAKLGVPIIPTYLVTEAVRKRLEQGEAFVFKPMLGERGNGILLARCWGDVAPIEDKLEQYLAQEFMPSIRQGERSLVYLGHEFQHAVLKKPSASNHDEFRCNESLGGTVAVYAPEPDELSLGQQILGAYEKLGFEVHFSRIDVIRHQNGPMLVEAELLNPSIYANYSKLGPEFGRAIAQYFHGLLSKSPKVSSERDSAAPATSKK